MTEEDLKYLIIFVLTDLKAELEIESLKAFMDYGFNYVVKSLTPLEHLKRPNSTELYEALPYRERMDIQSEDQKGLDAQKSIDFHFPKDPEKTLRLEEKYYSDPYKVQSAVRQFEDMLHTLREDQKKEAVAKLKRDFAPKEKVSEDISDAPKEKEVEKKILWRKALDTPKEKGSEDVTDE